MTKLSAAIITFNEEDKIEACLQSLSGIVDEVVLLDSFSTDSTLEIVREKFPEVKIYQQEFAGHVQQKNDVLDKTSYDFVLSLDADEVLDQKLRGSILALKGNGLEGAYSFSRLTYYMDQPIRHCGWYPDIKVRLFDKRVSRWGGVNPHDKICLQEGVKLRNISGDILHYSYDSISDHVSQTNYFTDIAAKEAFDRGIRSSYFKIVSRTLLKFIKDYFLKAGFLDGRYGFVICYINALSACLKYAKIRDLELEKVRR